jgi:hypothetical protein
MEQSIYRNNENFQIGCLETTCVVLAIKAMVQNFSEDNIVSSAFVKPERMQFELLSAISWRIESLHCTDEDYMAMIRNKRDRYKEMSLKLKFDEYYWVNIGVRNERKSSVGYCLLAIDKQLKEVVITKTYDERMKFLFDLGPEYESTLRYGLDLYNELSKNKEQ